MITHLKVPRAPHSLARGESARACDPVLSVSKPKSLTEMPLMVTCKRCVLTIAYRTAKEIA